MRLRPIVMTSACFVHMVPPYFATGAGAEMRRSLGTAVLWGAFGVTLFGIFLTPVFFYVVDWLTNRRRQTQRRARRAVPRRPDRMMPGDFHAGNGDAEYASRDLRTRREPRQQTELTLRQEIVEAIVAPGGAVAAGMRNGVRSIHPRHG